VTVTVPPGLADGGWRVRLGPVCPDVAVDFADVRAVSVAAACAGLVVAVATELVFPAAGVLVATGTAVLADPPVPVPVPVFPALAV